MPKTIITVDDSMSIRETVKMTLQTVGYKVLTAEDGARGLQLCKQEKADLIITDLDLPGMSGWQLANNVREIQPNIMVGLITGWALGASEQELKARGVDFVLAKPFSADALAEAVARAKRTP